MILEGAGPEIEQVVEHAERLAEPSLADQEVREAKARLGRDLRRLVVAERLAVVRFRYLDLAGRLLARLSRQQVELRGLFPRSRLGEDLREDP
jgi:hypothetical protein